MFEVNIDQVINENSENPTTNLSKEKEKSDVKIVFTTSEDDNDKKDSSASSSSNNQAQDENKTENSPADDKLLAAANANTNTNTNNQRLTVNSTTMKRPPIGNGDLRAEVNDEDKEDEEEKEIIEPKNITLDSLIDQLNNVSIIDDDHLPTRVLLGQLYYQTKNYELAEYWLQRSVKNNKNRGANGGKSGETTYFGGVTGSWGWEGWHWLGMSYNESNMGKENQAIKCLQYAVDLEHLSQPRGFECMSKFCPL
ncbi:hypothetical protein PIROE2DRAFT_15806 [Piromyces sp. E2]|nr:hypothetical protein PIROE2DRAFT_15806 [Piromyces sp. E2]|eukprot:OUM58837.1 hypothetical protein PIROE2DRAFT_15806 [Piromyces sp. E2]